MGKATLIGPKYGDFEQSVRSLERGGGIRVVERGELAKVLGELMADSATRARLGACGREVVRTMQGASARHAEVLLAAVDQTKSEL
jgi:3-deoxy-D-manno-octulosonic-acid transferase